VEGVRPVDAASWKPKLAGRIAEKQSWTVPQITRLPECEIIIRHICVEGRDYTGRWPGVPLRLSLERVGADLRALRRLPLRRRSLGQHRHGERAARADAAGHQVRV
jgi:hypothetical protein